MTDAQKENIRYLRGEGLGYRAIAARLGISENTVKCFCRRTESPKTERKKILLRSLPPRMVEGPPGADR